MHWLLTLILFGLVSFSGHAADYVLMIDASASMKNADAGANGNRRLDVVSEALTAFLREIPLESRVYLAAFNKVVTPQAEVVVRSEADIAKLIASVSDLEALVNESNSSNTFLWAALEHALQKGSDYAQVNVDQTVLVRVLTDGEDNDPKYGRYTKQHIVDNLRQKYPLVADAVTLVLLGSMDFRLKGISMGSAKNFHPSFPPAISLSTSNPRAGETVTLSDTSNQRFDSYDWLIDETLKNRTSTFSFIFPHSGDYKVKLRVVAPNGQRESSSTVVHVRDAEPPSFSFVPVRPEPDEPVNFYGKSPGKPLTTKWFIDGNEAGTGFELKKQFSKEGANEVVFTVQISDGVFSSATNQITVGEKPLIITFDAPSEVVGGTGVAFKNTTSGRAADWRWDFGDQSSSNDREPKHIFLNKGDQPAQYSVKLYARSVLGRDFSSEPYLITVHPSPKPPKSAFHVNQTNLIVGDLINFTDDSTGVITSHSWSFPNNAGKIDLKNPELSFQTPGEKEVSLTVTGPGGSDTAVQKVYIQPRETHVKIALVGSSPSSELPLEMDFKQVNPDHLRQNTFIGIENDTVEVSFSRSPEGSSAVIAQLTDSNNVFRVQLRKDGKVSPISLPARLQENSLLQIVLNTNAVEGNHEAFLTFQADGSALILNGSNQPVRLALKADINVPDPGLFILVLLVIVLAAIGSAIYYFLKHDRDKLTPRSQVVIGLAEEQDSSKTAPLSVKRKFKITTNETIVLGQSSDSKHVFDLQSPDWRIRRGSNRIILLNGRDQGSEKTLNSGNSYEVKTSGGVIKRFLITIEINPPSPPEKVKREEPKLSTKI